MSKELDFTAAWNEGMALLKAHREAALAITGVFMFLPQLIFGYMFPQPAFDTSNPETVFGELMAFYQLIAPWTLLMGILSGVGFLAINFIAINHTQPATGDAIVMGAKHYVTLLVASILSGLAIGIGLLLLLVPGLYLAVKFSQIRTVIAAENQLNPITVLSRSWEITKGNSLRIFAFVLIIVIVAAIAMITFNAVLGGGAMLILKGNAGLFISALVAAFSSAVITLLLEFINMGIYRQLTAKV